MVSYMFPPSSKHQGPHFPIPCCPEAFRCAVRHIETLDQYRGSIQLRQSPCLFKITCLCSKTPLHRNQLLCVCDISNHDLKGESLLFQQHHLVSTDLWLFCWGAIWSGCFSVVSAFPSFRTYQQRCFASMLIVYLYILYKSLQVTRAKHVQHAGTITEHGLLHMSILSQIFVCHDVYASFVKHAACLTSTCWVHRTFYTFSV